MTTDTFERERIAPPNPNSGPGPGPGPNSGLGIAMRRYWILPVLCAVILAAAGVAVGRKRAPVYSASATLAVGTTNVNTPAALGGFAASAPALAAAYSRAITAQTVVDKVAGRIHADQGVVRARLTASPVPQTPVIRIDGNGPTASSAIAIVNAGTAALVNYAGDLNQSKRLAAQIYGRYQKASMTLQQARSDVDRANNAFKKSPTDANRGALTQARAKAQAASLQERTLGDAYASSQEALGASNPVQTLQQASGATSDRQSRIQMFGFLGGVAGLIIGSALAIARGHRRANRLSRI
jgi:uncharacterized protein involved in exopolysaccharide biosynthesis